MHVYMILYHVHRKREDMYMEWIFCFRKGNRRNTNKIERRTLPSDIQKLKRAKELQKSMRMLCDSEESGSSSDDKTFVTVRSRQRLDNRRLLKQKEDLNGQKEIEEVNLTDSSENENLFNTSTNLTSYKQNKQKKSRGDQITKSIQDRQISKNKISSDSDNSSIYLSSNKTKQKRISKSIRTGRNINSCNSINFFDSESDKDVSTNRAPNISKSLSKNTIQDRKKNVNSSDAKSKDKAKKHHDSASESEDEDTSYKKQNSKRFNNNEEKKRKKKYDKSSKKHISNIQEDESDASSSKEFQKIKLQKVNHNKYSMRRLADLEIDYTKSPVVEENSAIESKENINDQLDMNLDNAKELVSDCKEIVLNLQTYINSVEQLYGKKDEEKFMLKMIKKINKLWPSLQNVQKNLTSFYQLKSSQKRKSLAIRRLSKEVNDDEQSSEETNVREKCATSENKICNSGNEQAGSKNVSECDSEIFSGNESRTLQKMQIIQNKIDTSNTENNVNVNNTESDDGDKELIDSSRDEDNADKNNMDLQNNLSSSPVLSVSIEKKKRSAERPTKKQLFSKINNNETPLTNEDNDSNDKQAKSDTDIPGSEIETEDSPLRNGNRKMTQNIEQDDSANLKDIINESMDLFDTSYHDTSKDAEENETEAQETAAETNCDDPKSLSKIKSLDISLQGGVLNEKDSTSLLLCDNEEENLLDQDNQKKLASVSATSEKIHNNLEELDISGKTNTDDIESLDDAETLAKKSLLESDSDLDNILDVDTKSIEGLIKDDVDQLGKSDEAKDDDDVNSTSTLILSSFLKKMNTNVETKVEVENKKDNQQTDEKSREETDSLNDDAKEEEAAKKALLESNSDDSTILSSSDSEENENKKTESNSSRENAKSKQALLASSNTESSSSEPTILNVEAANRLSKKSNNSKRYYEHESDEDSVASRLKRKRFILKNHHHWNDKKLRMFCEVRLKRLSRKDLRRYSCALQKSREYLEQKKFKRYRDFSLKPLLIVLHNLK